MNLPSGTVTFLFTDIEGSTRLWEAYPDNMRVALARHDELMRLAIERHGGHIFKTMGDAFCAAFHTAPAAVEAAIAAQHALTSEVWPEGVTILVRMALHSGAAEVRNDDYYGPTLNRTARLQNIAHGQQTLLTLKTAELVQGSMPANTTLSDLGTYRLKDLASPEQVWQLNPPGLPSAFPPLKSLDYLPTNLPQQLTSFIGREKEMADIQGMLGNSRLVTLTGIGGTGKTRLAVQAAAEVLDKYADGVWMAELAALSDAGLVPQAVAQALTIREVADEPIVNTLIAALRDKQMLLVLDNCEHVLDAAAGLLDSLLKSCPKLTVIASSREALRISGEQSYGVQSLSLPDSSQSLTAESLVQFEAARLFIDRAIAVRADFTVTIENTAAIAAICRRLDGIPLGIELAAARVRALSAQEIDARLDQRFGLLTGGSRTAMPRQQTLQAMLDWSYNLLSEHEKRLHQRLSVFKGGWTLDAAEKVCTCEAIEEWQILDLMSSLVDKSLICAEQKLDVTRYRLLETVRQYAWDRVAEGNECDTLRERHLEYFLSLAEEAEPHLRGGSQQVWLERLETENDNLRAAMDWSLSTNGEERDQKLECSGLRIAGAISSFWDTHGHLFEGRAWLSRALGARSGVDTAVTAKALNGAGILAVSQGDYASARGHHQASMTIRRELGDLEGTARSLGNLGLVAHYQGDYVSARALYTNGLAIRRGLGDRRGIALLLANLGNVDYVQGDLALAGEHYSESLTIRRELGDIWGAASTLCNLGLVAHDQGDLDAAGALYEEGLASFRELGDRQGIAGSLRFLGQVAQDQGDYADARSKYEQSLKNSRDLGDRRGVATLLCCLGNLANHQREFTTAQALCEESLLLHRELGNRRGIASALGNLAQSAQEQGDFSAARALYKESLADKRELADRHGIASLLESMAVLSAREARSENAAALWAAAAAMREELGTPLSPNEQEMHNHQVAEAMQIIGNAAAFEAAWEEGKRLTMDEACELALSVPLGKEQQS